LMRFHGVVRSLLSSPEARDAGQVLLVQLHSPLLGKSDGLEAES
jgi:hypothetical protein